MSEFNNPAAKTATTTYDISYAELVGANRGQRPDLIVREQGIYRTPDGKLYSSQGGQLLVADNLVPTLKTDPVTGGVVGLVTPASMGVFTFSGSSTSAVPTTGDTLNNVPIILPTGFIVTANSGVTALTVAIQASTDTARTQWVTLGVITLSAPGSGSFNSILPYTGYRANVVAISGGTCSAIASSNAFTTASAVTNPVYTGLATSGPQILSQSAIPVINPASGSVGNNGALTLGTALLNAYVNCWMYFAAGSVFSGSPAGVYFVKMSTTAAGVIYENVLSGQTPYIPAVPKPLVTTGPGAYAAYTAADITLVSVPLPAGLIGLNGVIRVTQLYEFDGASTSGSSAIGTTPATSVTVLHVLSSASNRGGGVRFEVRNRGVSNSQVLSASADSSGTGVMAAPQYISFDAAALSYVQLRAYVGGATQSVVLEGYTVEILPA